MEPGAPIAGVNNSASYEQQTSRLPTERGWSWRLFSFIAIFLIAVAGAYLGLKFGYAPFLDSRIALVDKQLADLATQIPDTDQEHFVQFYSQLVNLQSVLNKHAFAAAVFPLLEQTTDATVYYTSMDLSVADQRLTLEGFAKSYDALNEQLAAYSAAPMIKKYLLTDSQAVDGRTHFRVQLFLSPSLFKAPAQP